MIAYTGPSRPRPLAERFWEKVRKTDGCWEWTASVRSAGYGQIGYGRSVLDAHRVSWEFANGPIPDGLFVLHHCDNPPCVRPDHLFLGDHTANVRDMFTKGRNPQNGEHNPAAKLDWGTIVEIREWGSAGAGPYRIARAYGLNAGHVHNILKGKAWCA